MTKEQKAVMEALEEFSDTFSEYGTTGSVGSVSFRYLGKDFEIFDKHLDAVKTLIDMADKSKTPSDGKTCENCLNQGTRECSHCFRDVYREQDHWHPIPEGFVLSEK